MTRQVAINGRPDRLDWTEEGGQIRFLLAGVGVTQTASVARVEPNLFSVLMGGRSVEARVEETVDGLVVIVAGRRFAVESVDPRGWTAGARGRRAEGRQELKAPMPGKIVRVLAAEGDTVEAGQGLVVVEAMKMQNEIKAPKAGRVLTLPARPGASVNAGEILATIE